MVDLGDILAPDLVLVVGPVEILVLAPVPVVGPVEILVLVPALAVDPKEILVLVLVRILALVPAADQSDAIALVPLRFQTETLGYCHSLEKALTIRLNDSYYLDLGEVVVYNSHYPNTYLILLPIFFPR